VLYLLLAAGAAIVWWGMHAYPTGHGPFDTLPAGLGTRSPATTVTAPTTGLVYETWTYPTTTAGVQFHVAALKQHLGWISYYFEQATGNRSYYAGWVPSTPGSPSIEQLEKDFGL
jgi:hypothetical protein